PFAFLQHGGLLLDVREGVFQRADQRRRVGQLGGDHAVGVDVRIDEAGQDGLALGVDDACLVALVGEDGLVVADGDDLAGSDGGGGGGPGVEGDDFGVVDDEVGGLGVGGGQEQEGEEREHGWRSLGEGER